MALRKALQRFIFAQGVESKIDSHVTPLGKLHRLMNGRFNRVGAISKRAGLDTTTSNIRPQAAGITTLPVCYKAVDWNQTNFPLAKNNLANQTYLSPKIGFYPNETSGAVSSWSIKSGFTGLTFKEQRNSSQNLFGWHVQDCAAGNGFVCTVYSTTNASTENLTYSFASTAITVVSKVQVILMNAETGNVIFSIEYNSSSNPKVVFKDNKFHFFYLDSGGSANILCRSIDTTSTTLAPSGASSIISDLSVTANKNVYDVCADANNIYIAYINTGGKIKVSSFTNPPTITAPAATYTGADNAYRSVFITACTFGIVVAYAQETPDPIRCRYLVLTTSVTLSTGPFTFFTSTNPTYGITGGNRVVSTVTYGNVIPILCWTFLSAASGNVNYVYTCEINAAGTTPAYTDGDTKLPHLYPVSKIFSLDSNTQDCFIGLHATTDTTAAQYVAFRIPRGFCENASLGVFHAVGRWGLGEAPNGFTSTFGSPMSNIGVDSNFCYFPSRRLVREYSKSLLGSNYTVRIFSPSVIKFPIIDVTSGESVNLGGTSNLTSGILEQFDGDTFSHNNYLRAPEIMQITTTGSGAAAALDPSSTYSYIATYEWTDSLGKVHRSSPSLPVTITTPVGVNAAGITVRYYGWDPERTKYFQGYGGNVVVKLFRTEGNGEIFYALLEIPDLYNSASGTVTDAATDTKLIENEILYVQSGEFYNYTPTGVTAMTVWNNRAWVIAYDGIRYSKFTATGDPLEFAQEFILDLEEEGGDPIAIAPLDTKLIIFKKNRIYYITGDGPNDAGAGGTFSYPQLISATEGATSPQGVVTLGNKILFRSPNGFKQITSDFVISDQAGGTFYFQNGDNSETSLIRSSDILGKDDEVRFLDSANAYIYNYDINEWSMYPSVNWLDANGDTVITSAGAVLRDSTSTRADAGTNYSMSITTGWISLADIQGFQRIYRTLFLGKALVDPSTFSIKIEIEYDFIPEIIQTVTFNGASQNIWTNDESKYFSSIGGATAGSFPFQLRIHMDRQKCQSVRYTISDTSLPASGLSFDAVGLAIEYGVEGNAYKVKPGLSR